MQEDNQRGCDDPMLVNPGTRVAMLSRIRMAQRAICRKAVIDRCSVRPCDTSSESCKCPGVARFQACHFIRLLAFAVRNRIILIRRELRLTVIVSPAVSLVQSVLCFQAICVASSDALYCRFRKPAQIAGGR
jgi:hypothetical protein